MARLQAWAIANNASFDANSKEFSAPASANNILSLGENDSSTALIVAASAIGVLGVGGLLLLRKKKQD